MTIYLGKGDCLLGRSWRDNSIGYLPHLKSLTRVTYPGNKTVSYEYDMAGRRVRMTDPNGGITRYTYNVASRLTSLTDPQNLTTRYIYDAARRLTQITLGNGSKTLYTYSGANSLIKVEHRKSDDTFINSFDYVPVSYTHLTLPTKRIV